MKFEKAFNDHKSFAAILEEALNAEETIEAASRIGHREAPAGTEELFRSGFQSAVSKLMPTSALHSNIADWRSDGSHGLVREVPIGEVAAPVTKHGYQKGNIDLVAVSSPNADQPFLSAIELKVMPFPHWESPGHYLWQICVDHARLHFAEGFAELQCGWVVLLLHGPWITRYRPDESDRVATTDIKQIYHDMMHRDFSSLMARGDLNDLDNRHTHGYDIASAHLLGFDKTFSSTASLFSDYRMITVADFERNTAIVAHRADWTDRWGG